ncbi:MAG: tungstate ABC transporter substrate-binding protein WtpA [Syntrophomonadaceae bacterium]
MNFPKYLCLFLIISLLSFAPGCSGPAVKQEPAKVGLKVIIAGSLLVPFQALEKEFESRNPDIDVLLDGHGSVQVIRSVTELGNIADITAVADAQLIPLMMYSTPMPESDRAYADWTLKFSTNRLGIAYTDASAHASEISADNWYRVLSRPDVSIGLADPRIDAMGYRTLMAIQLAEDYYRDDTIFETTIGSAFQPPIMITGQGSHNTITVPEVVKSAQARVKLRSYSIQLMALLESGDLDYSFEYESVAKQRGLKFLTLPAAIDLSDPASEDGYRQVEVNLDFKRFASVVPNFKGTQIVYGLTIPNNALHPREAARFINFMLGPEGRRIFEDSHQPLLMTPQGDNSGVMPAELRSLFK